jgi:integrase
VPTLLVQCKTVGVIQDRNRQFANRCRKAGVRYIKVHDTGRSCASLLVALDVRPRVAMQILRHSQIAMTMEIYSEMPTAKTRSALTRLGRQLDGQGCCTSVLYGDRKRAGPAFETST